MVFYLFKLDDKAEDDTVDDDACKKTIQEPASEYDQALKNVLDKMMDQEKEATEQSDAVRKEFEAQCDSQLFQEKITRASSTNSFNNVSTPVNTTSASRTFSPIGPSSGPSFVPFGGSLPIDVANLPHDPLMPELEDTAEIRSTGIFGNAYDDHDLETLNTPYADQSVGAEADFNNMEPSTVVSPIPTTRVHSTHPKAQRRTNHKDFQNCLFACFLSQHEPTKISQALYNESWVEAMQEELILFKIQKVWTLVDLPSGKKAFGTKIEAIRLFLAFASFANFPMYQMDVKRVFLYGTIEEEVYVCQPPSFVDLEFLEKVYKVEKALYGLHQAPSAWYETLSTYLLDNGFHRGQIDKTLFIKRLKGDILLVQVYVDDIIFGSTKKSLCDEFEQIMHNRFQVQPKVFHLNAVKRIFRYLKGQPKLGLWYPKDSPLILEAFSDSDYAGANLDRKSTTGDLLTKASDVSRFNFLVASIGKRGRDTKIPQSGGPPIKVGDEAVHKELGDRMEMDSTTTSSLEVE
ncbi:putative ribonuclease H-like domain-containing protein [Tanacetum coccineum]